MTIPEQAVEAAAAGLDPNNYYDPNYLRKLTRAALTAALPLVGVQRPEEMARQLRILLQAGGNLSDEEVDVLERNILALFPVQVQRPEDVARVKEAFERQFPQYKRDGFTGGDRQDYETLKAALPHTGRRQSRATAIGDRDSLDYMPIVGLGVDALEARKEHGEAGPEITENALAESLRRTHTGQPQEGEIIGALKQTAGYLERWADEPECGYFYGLVVDAISRASQSPAPQAGCAKEGWRELVEYVRWVITEGPFDGCHLDAAVIQDKAEKLGILIKTKYDPAVHGDSGVCEPGDDWFVFAPWCSASPPPPVAESAPPSPFPIDWTSNCNHALLAEEQTEAK